MRKYYYLVALLLPLLIAAGPAGWYALRSAAGKFQAQMPLKPQLAKGPANNPYEYYTLEIKDKNIDTNYYYGLVYMPLKTGEGEAATAAWKKQFWARSKKEILEAPGHLLIYEKDIKLNGHAGKEYLMSDKGHTTLITYRLYLYKDAVYQLFTGTPVDHYPTQGMRNFFASFRVSR